ncbi:MAG: pseudouridine synthase [Puia sp.]|nr:pseudouridine synthase [Puia sp.]
MKRKTDNFNKFFHKKRNSAIKEEFRQEKKAIKKERKEAIERHFEEKRRLKYKPDDPESGGQTKGPRQKAGKANRKPAPVAKHSATAGPFKAKPGRRPEKRAERPERTGERPERTRERPEGTRERPARNGQHPDQADKGPEQAGYRPGNPEQKKGKRPERPRQGSEGRGERSEGRGIENPGTGKRRPGQAAPAPFKGAVQAEKPFKTAGKPDKRDSADHKQGTKPRTAKAPQAPQASSAKKPAVPAAEATLPLNKYIAHGGICSRRDAADLIRQGKVLVNGKPVTEPGTKVSPEDQVKVNGKKVTISRNFVYILLNKPKDYITTTDDPQGRRTVLDLIRQATVERVYPVGRLDRNTSGVLLLTNDGELAQKLAHPKHEIRKIYHVVLDKSLTKADFDKIVAGVVLEDGIANIDAIAYADPKDKTQIGLEIHSGRNRIVRRIFEHLGYDVKGLDRVMYAGLTKKNVQRGKWRLLSEKEIRILKYLNSATK